MMIQWLRKKYLGTKKRQEMGEKRKNKEHRTGDRRFPLASLLGACGQDLGLSQAGLLKLLLNLGACCPGKWGRSGPAATQTVMLGIMRLVPCPLQPYLSVPHAVEQAHWNLVAVSAMYLKQFLASESSYFPDWYILFIYDIEIVHRVGCPITGIWDEDYVKKYSSEVSIPNFCHHLPTNGNNHLLASVSLGLTF